MPKMPKPRHDSAWKFVSEFKPKSLKVAHSDEDIAGIEFVVCVFAEQKTVFTDNVFAFCCKCDAKVQHRPHVPAGPKPLCYDCARKLAKEDGDIHLIISEATAAEFEWNKKRQ